MIKFYWDKIIGCFAGGQNNPQLLARLRADLEQLNNENLSRHYKKISKFKIDVLETPLEHHTKFIEALNDAKESIVLLSNWAKIYIMNDEFESSMRSCLARGVNVYVGYVSSQSNNSNLEADSELKAKKKFKELEDWCFRKHGQDCRMRKIDTSASAMILIVDDKYLINSNCKNEDRSWVIYDRDFVASERNAIIGKLDGPLEITRRGLLRSLLPSSLS